LAVAGNEDLTLAWLFLLAGKGSMAYVLIGMAARLLRLTASLLTSLAVRILALPWSMAGFAAEMRSTTELVATDIATANILQPTLLILEGLLSAHTPLLHKERAFGTSLIILVAVVGYLRMTACLCAFASVSARRRLGTAW
jgi:hypothetical protein